MTNPQPRIVSENGRSLPCSPVAVVVLVVNRREELLTGFHRTRQRWEAISGVLEAGESVLDGALRELREEMGPVRARALGVVHASTFRYDGHARFMIGITYLMAHEGGEIVAGDDMHGGGHRWVSLADLAAGRADVAIPREPWLAGRALDLYRLWKDEVVVLQPPLPEHG